MRTKTNYQCSHSRILYQNVYNVYIASLLLCCTMEAVDTVGIHIPGMNPQAGLTMSLEFPELAANELIHLELRPICYGIFIGMKIFT